MKILIFGAGGVGSDLGGFLARTGHEVSLLGRPWHLDEIKKNGLTISGIWGDYRMKAFDLYKSPAEAAGKPFELVILTVKAFDTRAAVDELLPLLGPETMLLSLQNGLGNIEAIAEKVPKDRTLIGRVIFGVETQPGVATVTVTADPPVVIGPAPGGKPKLPAERAAQILANAKIPATPVADVLPAIWAKVIYNCALNPICTLRDMPYGAILDNPETRAQMEEVVRECYAVGKKKGIALDPPDADAFLKKLVNVLIPATAAHRPSMLQDLRRKKRTDVDALNGAIARLGAELGVPTPVNARLTAEIHARTA